LLGVDHEIEEGVDPVELVVADGADRLLSHGALVGVSGRLIVMRVRDQSSDGSEDGEGLDLQMGRPRHDHVFVEGDERVVLLVAVEILDEAGGKKVVEGVAARFEALNPYKSVSRKDSVEEKTGGTQAHLHVGVGHSRNASIDDDHGSTDPSSIAGDIDDSMMMVDVDADELGHLACSTELSEVADKPDRRWREADDVSVDVDHVRSWAIELVAGDERAV
jgi:hypothetical protein